MTASIALHRKDDGRDTGVAFSDFPGCVTAGGTLDEARRMAAEALELHLEGMHEDGAAVRVNVMLPEDLVATIDRMTKNRSRFLAEAARAKLHALS
jgi:predicted RNase H-like HicB family nuclease